MQKLYIIIAYTANLPPHTKTFIEHIFFWKDDFAFISTDQLKKNTIFWRKPLKHSKLNISIIIFSQKPNIGQ